LKEYLKKHFINSRGTGISQRVLVIESDDWGSIRIPNRDTQDYLAHMELIRLSDPFSKYDCLECESDYQALYNVLGKYKDSEGNCPIITANMVMCNPDFEKIRNANYQHFFTELFSTTYNEYHPEQNTLKKLHEGIYQKFIYPQFHAREHLNVLQWIKKLQNKDERFLNAFELKCFSIEDTSRENGRSNLMASYDYRSEEELAFIRHSISEGLQLFNQNFGFQSITSTAPCYVWNGEIEKSFAEEGVIGIQGSYIQQRNKNGVYHRVWQKMGRTNMNNQKYFIRNVLFEPSLSNKINWVDKAMESIAIAFYWGKPAIIGSHRINYVAGLSEENRSNSLEQLDELLNRILKKWPDIMFINSEQLLVAYS
jgi:hypothetical protein